RHASLRPHAGRPHARTRVPEHATELTRAEAAKRPPLAAQSAHGHLFQLFKDSDEDNLKRNPLNALFRGDMRYADRLGDNITDQYYAGERAAAEHDLAALHAIPRAQLNQTDQLAYDVFEYSTKDTLRGLQPDMLALTVVRPLNHFFGIHTFYPTFASGKGGAPFKTLADYENNLKRHKDFVTYLDRAIGRFREGEQSGVVETKMTVRNMIEQLDNQLKMKPEDSPYFGPVKEFPAGISDADKARLTAESRTAVTGEIYPALTRLRDFFQTEYLAKAREGSGLKYMPGGEKLYAYLIRSTTTTDMTPAQIHALGPSEVTRITKEFDKVRREAGFKGTLPQFFDFTRTSPKYQPKSREQLTADYYALQKKVEAQVPRFFSLVPKSPLRIQP